MCCQGIASLHNMRSPMVHGDFKPSDVLVTARAKVPKITNFGLWDFKKFFIENTMAEDVVFLNPHQAPEVIIIARIYKILADLLKLTV